MYTNIRSGAFSAIHRRVETALPATPESSPPAFTSQGYYKSGEAASKITARVLGWVEDSLVRSDTRDFGVGEPFLQSASLDCLVAAGPQSLGKMLNGEIAFEISDIQKGETADLRPRRSEK